MTIDINLQWLSFNVDCNTIDAWVRANANPNSDYAGLSANSVLQLHFLSEPGADAREALLAYWSGLDESSPEHTNYKTADERKAEAEAATAAHLVTATAKLESLGLSADEIAALRG